MGTNYIGVIIIVGLCIGIFLVCREIVLWYFKINKLIQEQTKTNFLLSKILIQLGGTSESKPASVEAIEDTKTYDFLDEKGKVRNVTTKTGEKAGWTLIKK
jgi:hypothetical protein